VSSPSHALDGLGNEVLGVLARSIPSRLVEISRSGCLLESAHRIEDGTVGELRLEVDGATLVDDVRITRCVRIEGAGASYLVGAEFVQTRRAAEQSIRRAVTGVLRRLASPQGGASAATKRGERGGGRPAPVNSKLEGEGAMKALLARFVREDEGQDIIEYALLAGLIITGATAAITAIGTRIRALLTNLQTDIGA
jgi:pilus assembly protein Flp/PilA